MKLNSIVLTDNVITIRPFELNYAQEQLDNEDEAHTTWVGGGKSTLEGIQNWIKKNHLYWKQDGPVYNFAIVLNDGNKFIGMVEASTDREKITELESGDANISYSLFPFARGNGYATLAVNLITKFLQEKGIKRAMIRIDPDNTASLKVPERCGFAKRKTITTDNKQLVIFIKNI